MRLTLRDDLPFVAVTVVHGGASIEVPDVLVDTGSASTVLSVDILGIVPDPADRLRTLRGVGGRGLVFTRCVDRIEVGGRGLDHFEVEIAAWTTAIGGLCQGLGIHGSGSL